MERALVTDYLIDSDQKVLHGWMKTMFLGDVEIAVRSGETKSGIMAFSTSDIVWDCCFFFNGTYILTKLFERNHTIHGTCCCFLCFVLA